MFVTTKFKRVKHYKTVRSALMHNQSDLIRFGNTIYKGFGWMAQSSTCLTLHYDAPCKISLDRGIWNLEVK